VGSGRACDDASGGFGIPTQDFRENLADFGCGRPDLGDDALGLIGASQSDDEIVRVTINFALKQLHMGHVGFFPESHAFELLAFGEGNLLIESINIDDGKDG